MRKKCFVGICILINALWFSGCSGTELENKSFPLAVLISQEGQRYNVCYLSQQLSEVSSERADGGNMTAAGAAGSTYYETHKTYEKNNRCELDMSHTKAIIFQGDFIKSSAFLPFLETVQRENTYARNTLVYLADSSMEKMAELNNTLEIPLGSYLEQMTENEKDMKEQAVVTLGALLNEQENQSRTLLLPVLQEENGLPKVGAYEVLACFEPKGRIGTKEAQVYYLLSEQLEQMDLKFAQDVQVRLSGLSCGRDFSVENGRVAEQLTVKANAECITKEVPQTEIAQKLKEMIEEACRKCQEKNTDLSDSGRYLAMKAPKIYRQYKGRAEQFRQNLDYQVHVQIRMIGLANQQEKG